MPSSRKPLSKAEKSLALVCLLIVLPAAGLVYFVGGRDAEPKWNIPAAPTPPVPNGYDYYVAATKATVRFTPEVDQGSDSSSHAPNSPYALKNYSVARRLQWIKANGRTFALINQGLATPSMAPTYTFSKPLGDWGVLRQLARDMSARTHTFKMQHQPMRATMSALDTMQMGQDTTRNGGMIARLVGMAMIAIGRAPLEDWNQTINALGASEARTAAQRLEALLAHEPTAAQILTVDKRDNLIELRRIFTLKGWRSTLIPPGNEGVTTKASRWWQSQTISKQAICDHMNRALDAQIAHSKLPYSQAMRPSLPRNLDVFTDYLVGSGGHIISQEARNTTSDNMLLLRLALRAYIAEHGVAPPTLAPLVPGILKSVPTDVYNDGKPLFYTQQGKTYKLWSVGPDMVNNGGVPFPPRNGGVSAFPAMNTLDNKGDFVAGLCR